MKRVWILIFLTLAVLAAAGGFAVWRTGAGPVSAGNGAAECRLVAEIDAARWRALAAEPYVAGRGAHFVTGWLAGAPQPWKAQADDGWRERLRLWASGLRGAGVETPLDCRAVFAAAGLQVDPGYRARPAPEGVYTEVSSYSRVRFPTGREWALVQGATCEPGPSATDITPRTAIYERRDGRWREAASDAAPRPAILTRRPWPERGDGAAAAELR